MEENKEYPLISVSQDTIHGFFSKRDPGIPDEVLKEELQKAIDNMYETIETQSKDYSLLANAYHEGLISKEILACALQTGELKVSEYVKIITSGYKENKTDSGV